MAWSRVSRHKRGYGTAWDKLRKVILTRDKHLCQPCMKKGRVTPARTVNHIKPKAQGGTDDPDNLESICDPCHAEETARQSAEAQGRTYRTCKPFGIDGWPVD